MILRSNNQTSTSTTITYHQLPYTLEELTVRFTPLADYPWSLLLHSGACEHPFGRFDILVADPLITLVTCGAITTITSKNSQQISYEDPMALLQQQLQNALPSLTPDDQLPFQGGAVGLFTYDLGRRFETLPKIATAVIQHPEMAVGIYDWALIADHHRRQLTLICHSDLQQRLAWLQRQQPTQRQPFVLTEPWHANMSYADYAEKFSQIQAALQNGDCYQINLAHRFSARYQGDVWRAFQCLNTHNRAPFSAFLKFPWATVLSFSPERFLQLVLGKVTTRPIKGTRRRHHHHEQDVAAASALATSLKERSENLMIVDLLRNDIGRVALPGTVRVPELFIIESFPAVHHLVSTITATLDPHYSALDLLRAAFPGGSITGVPKIEAMTLIEKLEPQRRTVYCGSIGYISCCATMDTNIAIRTLLAESNIIHCWTGGAIIADSDVVAEYQESLDKVSRILPILTALTLQ